jgi:hypothetical protein
MVLRQLREYQADDEELSGLVEMVDGLFFGRRAAVCRRR